MLPFFLLIKQPQIMCDFWLKPGYLFIFPLAKANGKILSICRFIRIYLLLIAYSLTKANDN